MLRDNGFSSESLLFGSQKSPRRRAVVGFLVLRPKMEQGFGSAKLVLRLSQPSNNEGLSQSFVFLTLILGLLLFGAEDEEIEEFDLQSFANEYNLLTALLYYNPRPIL